MELLHVGGVGQGRQGVGAAAEQDVAEGSVDGRHVGREEVVFHLERHRGDGQMSRSLDCIITVIENLMFSKNQQLDKTQNDNDFILDF